MVVKRLHPMPRESGLWPCSIGTNEKIIVAESEDHLPRTREIPLAAPSSGGGSKLRS